MHEIDANHPWPLVGAGLVQHFKVFLLSQCLKSKEDEGSAEIRMLLHHLEVHLIEGLHEHALVVCSEDVPFVVILIELAEEGPKLDPFVAVPDVLEEDMAHVLLKDVEGEDEDEKVADLLLK